jgi:hypothetical protein
MAGGNIKFVLGECFCSGSAYRDLEVHLFIAKLALSSTSSEHARMVNLHV